MKNSLLEAHDDCADYADRHDSVFQVSDGFRLRFEGVGQWLNQTAKSIAHALMGSSDPFIWQKTDRNGNTWWIIDDPLTGTRFHAVSEEEVRAWIEQHYYMRSHSVQNHPNDVDLFLTNRW